MNTKKKKEDCQFTVHLGLEDLIDISSKLNDLVEMAQAGNVKSVLKDDMARFSPMLVDLELVEISASGGGMTLYLALKGDVITN